MATKFKRLVINKNEMVIPFHLMQVQDNIDLAITQLQNSQFQSGVFVVVTLAAAGADNVVNHGLGRSVQGWTIVDKNASADVWQSTTTNNFPDKQILLKASAAVTVKLYLF